MIMCDDDDDDNEDVFLYECGHWTWDTDENQLTFIRDDVDTEESSGNYLTPTIRHIEFRDDIDLMEQQKFMKKYQRKTTEDDVVCLQDVKDIVFYIAPVSILSPAVINMLHLPTTERFLRALILYCQYYLQITDIMEKRNWESERKIRYTTNTDLIEDRFRKNLQDIRLLIAKEYVVLISNIAKYTGSHYTGSFASQRNENNIIIDAIIRMTVHIVWITLGRKQNEEIELEIYRLFQSDIYNGAMRRESNLRKINSRTKLILFGACMKAAKKVNPKTPLVNEILCKRKYSYKILGLGDIEFERLSKRMQFFQNILIEPEHNFEHLGINLGILGHPRKFFDTMLREISVCLRKSSRPSKTSILLGYRRTQQKQTQTNEVPVQIVIPDPEILDFREAPDNFPLKSHKLIPCNQTQRHKWLNRIKMFRRRTKRKSHRKIY